MKNAYRLLLLGAFCVGLGCQTVPETQVAVEIAPPEEPRLANPIIIDCPKSISANFLFKWDSATMLRESIETLIPMAAELREYNLDTVQLEGHTCDLGDPAYNMALGHKRAEAVKAVLVSLGVAPERITCTSAGGTLPAVPNDSEAMRRLNRRVELNVKHRNRLWFSPLPEA